MLAGHMLSRVGSEHQPWTFNHSTQVRPEAVGFSIHLVSFIAFYGLLSAEELLIYYVSRIHYASV